MKEKLRNKTNWLWKASPFIVAFLFSLSVNAQQATVGGKVTAEGDDSGLPGVNVIVKGTSIGTVTDLNGDYSLQTEGEDGVLVFSSVGYTAQEIVIGSQSVINVVLIEDVTALEEIVVIGYGTQKKSDLTGSVGQVKGDEIAKLTTANATNAIQGRMAGVRVEANGGAPGAQTLVTIRGSGTMSDRQPLYVIDGMLTNSMDMLNPHDIESVNVLKDASATAIYGSRAANGVVVVTTKKGTKGGINISADFNYGVQTPANLIDWANNEQYAQVIRDGFDNDAYRNGTTPEYTDDISSAFDPSINSDDQGESLRNAPISNLNFSIGGGGENGTYNFSAGHLFQDGIVKESSFERTNLRINSTFKKGRFRFEQTMGLTRTINNPNPYFNQERGMVPTIPMYDSEGNFTARREDGASTFAQAGNLLGRATVEDRTNTGYRVLGNLAGSFEIVKGLTYKLNYGLDYGHNHNYTFTPTFNFSDSPGNGGFSDFNRLDERNDWGVSQLIEHTLNYKNTFGKHTLDLLAGYGWQESNWRRLGAQVNTFPSNDIRNAQEGEVVENTPSFDNTTGLVSYFGRLNYNFDDRYLLTATIRRDGSSLFREDLRWGNFPSFAAGWNISNESFMSNVTWLQGLKLRASYGEMGSNNAPPYVGDAEINVNSTYPLDATQGQTRIPGYSITKAVNENLKWETTKITDIGVEFGLFDADLLITMDYFIKESQDVIAPYTPPPWQGRSGTADYNMASVENKGFEFTADYRKSFGDFNFGANFNFTILDNVVTDVGFSGPILGGGFTSNGRAASLTQTGLPIGAFWGLKVEGIYQSEQEAIDDGRYILADPDDPGSEKIATAGGGDLNFQDLDGMPGLSDDDMQYLGSPIPDFEYGLNLTGDYKGFDFTMFFNGVSGNKIVNGNTFRAWFENDNNVYASMVDAWTPDRPSKTMPRYTVQDLGQNGTRMSDFLLESGSYFRLRNLVIGYTLPQSAMDAIKISNIRFYATAQNLFTITEYSGYYPEVGRGTRGRGNSNQDIFNAGVDERAYPTAKTYQLGIQVTF